MLSDGGSNVRGAERVGTVVQNIRVHERFHRNPKRARPKHSAGGKNTQDGSPSFRLIFRVHNNFLFCRIRTSSPCLAAHGCSQTPFQSLGLGESERVNQSSF